MDIRLAILTKGQLFGERDYITDPEKPPSELFYTYSVRCRSATGEAYSIKKDEFISKMKFSPEATNIFMNT